MLMTVGWEGQPVAMMPHPSGDTLSRDGADLPVTHP